MNAWVVVIYFTRSPKLIIRAQTGQKGDKPRMCAAPFGACGPQSHSHRIRKILQLDLISKLLLSALRNYKERGRPDKGINPNMQLAVLSRNEDKTGRRGSGGGLGVPYFIHGAETNGCVFGWLLVPQTPAGNLQAEKLQHVPPRYTPPLLELLYGSN